MLIRKIAVGSDYKNAMNYVVGQTVLGGTHTVYSISESKEGSVSVWVYNEELKEATVWKKFNKNTPVHFEYNIDF
jgi:hypothetical protein